jgi:hypothetical protein
MANMAKQMELFDEGGLMQEGGTVDPVSGNDVPVGSTQEEVRDDIPAQLSEGEFVMPADVVRYHGLDKMMTLRDEAKMGLQRMDDMGQMGNSEEAIIPDGVPFNMDDLEMEDDGQGALEFNVGGAVSMPGFSGIGGYTPPAPVTTGFKPYAAPSIPTTGLQQQAVPQVNFQTATGTTNLPTFGQVVGTGAGQYDEFKTYVNDAGQTLQIPFKDGKPIYPIPEGYKLKSDEAQTGTGALGQTGTQTTKVRESDGQGDNQDYGGGTSLLTGEKIAGYSPEEIKTGVTTAKERFAITGNRGIDLLNLMPGGTFLKNLAGEIGGPVKNIAANVFGKDPIYSQDMRGDIFGVKGGEKGLPGERFSGQIADARYEYEQVLGTKMTGYVGFEKGDLDPNSGGFFNSRGVAVDADGNPVNNENGTKNFSSFTDFKNHMAAAIESGWYGGELSVDKASKLNAKAQSNYRNYVKALNKQYPDDKIEGPKIAVPTSKPRRGDDKPATTTPSSRVSDPASAPPSDMVTPSTPPSFEDPYESGSFAMDDDAFSEGQESSSESVGADTDTGYSGGSMDDFGDYGGYEFKKGGLASQMKRSGLASKK